MAEVRQVPGAGYVTTSDDGEVKQVPGLVFFNEEEPVTAEVFIDNLLDELSMGQGPVSTAARMGGILGE